MQIPASNLRTNRFHRLVGNCRAEIDEVLPFAILRSPRPKRVAQKIELLVRVRPSPILILAIDNLRLFGMKLQPTLLQASGYGRPNLLGFHFCPAMHDGIIGETLKRHLPILRRHPPIKRIMQKQIGQQRADDTALACPSHAEPTGRPPLALALSTSARCREPSMVLWRVSSPPVSADLAGCCRRNP